MTWVYLLLAILAEVIATTALKLSNGFTQARPAAITVAGYVIAFYFLALTLRTMPVGVAYAIWSGVGVVAITLIGYFRFGQVIDAAGLIGIALITAGVLVLNLFSRTVA
ncbi:MAG TPA: multidrug efflux SMR transporter [Burkholderiaceae bacterium]|nr:multidrug efflux SMR transporter [Burkholderiaceae bacterium]